MRVLTLGTSATELCGVRTNAALLTAAMALEGAAVETCWWEQQAGMGLVDLRRGFRSFATAAVGTAASFIPDYVLLHYSVFTWAFHGVPVLVPGIAATLRRIGKPAGVLLHEYALPLTGRSPKNDVVAVTQRLALVRLLRACACAIVTTEQRLASLTTRVWLPRVPLDFLPTPSNVDRVVDGIRATGDSGVRVGVLGFATYAYPSDVVTAAIARLRSDGQDVRLVLVGAPGASGERSRAWTDAAAHHACADSLSFTGILAEEGLSRSLSALDVLIFADPGGPASRKTTLAAGLAHALPVVAFAGPERWELLVRSGAVALSALDAGALAAALTPLVTDATLRKTQGDRARAFYDTHMAATVVARDLMAVLHRSAGVACETRREVREPRQTRSVMPRSRRLKK